ncbi:HAD family hydrolase [Sulfolobus sp. E5-1-F]|uniref:HAD family hydrolase n=1 Tax=Sulfolobaceae TaxID=118883 RepID=UPI001296AE00|nr:MULTISPECIES: HAD family hydrolase [unclassified Sulfolobus]QGA54232.1 HAD family hydrolase [Sulfolobus sp. E5-1-F]QGA69289.1 HAD family hydrolase [Sulfolobus sp. E11-6]
MVNFAVWLDGVILKIDLTDLLYKIYKGDKIDLPITYDVNDDWLKIYDQIREMELAILSPYDEITTKNILERIDLKPSYVIANRGRTKPSKEPYRILIEATRWDPLQIVTLASSPLDLLSARFFDSRIKVVCVKRYQDCSRYSPFLYSDNLEDAISLLKRLKIIR